MKIKTNHQYRDLLNAHDLTKKELKEFDYMTNEELHNREFFRYRGDVYCMNDFVRIVHKGKSDQGFAHHDLTGNLKGWHGIKTDSFFSAVVIAFNKNYDAVKIGLALS